MPIARVENYTGAPECFEGRVKTLHPKIAGGILFRRGKHDAEAEELGIQPIDLVVCNFYDFASAQAKGLPDDELIEAMDIGGPTMVRAAAKNYASVAVVVDPADYDPILDEIRKTSGISLETRKKLAAKALCYCADYDARIASELAKRFTGEEQLRVSLSKGKKLRYGENPDQEGWVYEQEGNSGITQAEVLSGKELSYNNYEDAAVAYRAAEDLWRMAADCGVAVIKHGSLCGYATGSQLADCFQRAWDGDSKSAFGSVIAFTCTVDEGLEEKLKGKFIELLIAPDFTPGIVDWLKAHKPNCRLLKVKYPAEQQLCLKSISGGMLVQTPKCILKDGLDRLMQRASEDAKIGIVTDKSLEAEKAGLIQFALAAACHAKSNAVVIARESTPGCYATVGIGAGQPNRVDSLQRLAMPKAMENLQEEFGADPDFDLKEVLKDCVLASDGFFPFPDSVEEAAAFGIGTCVQPGGSVRDPQVIEAANAHGICMIMTGERAFTH